MILRQFSLLMILFFLNGCHIENHQAKSQPVSTALPIATTKQSVSERKVDSTLVVRNLKALASDAFEGRKVGTKGGIMARDHVRKQFAKLGLKAFGKSYLQEFDGSIFNKTIGLKKQKVKGYNIVGYISGSTFPNQYIALAAHYDHIGIQKGEIYNGADDNASGVGALLGIAQYFTQHPPKHSIVFLAFDAEEHGLQGSNWFAQHPLFPLKQLKCLLNMDMVSRSDVKEIYACGTAHFPSLIPLVQKVTKQHSSIKVSLGHDRPKKKKTDPENWTYASDHAPFFKQGIAFLYFGVEDHPDYHKASDEFDKINLNFYLNVVGFILDVALELDGMSTVKE